MRFTVQQILSAAETNTRSPAIHTLPCDSNEYKQLTAGAASATAENVRPASADGAHTPSGAGRAADAAAQAKEGYSDEEDDSSAALQAAEAAGPS